MHELIVAFGVITLLLLFCVIALSIVNGQLRCERDSWERVAESRGKELERLRDLAKQMRAED